MMHSERSCICLSRLRFELWVKFCMVSYSAMSATRSFYMAGLPGRTPRDEKLPGDFRPNLVMRRNSAVKLNLLSGAVQIQTLSQCEIALLGTVRV